MDTRTSNGNQAIELPEWAYELLAREAVSGFGGSSECLRWRGEWGAHDQCLFDIEEEMTVGGRDIWVCLRGVGIGVDITDESFTHEFGTEYRTGYELTGLEELDGAEAYDAETDERLPLRFDRGAFEDKVNALC